MLNYDHMRSYLVTRFVCAKCGGRLLLSTDVPKSRIDHFEEDDGITGAAKVEQRVAIHPCEKCYGDVARPVQLLKEALSISGDTSE